MALSISLGEVFALACAFLWGLNGLILRTQSHKISPAAMNMTRCAVGGLLYWMLLPLGAPLSSLEQVSLQEWGLLSGSVIIGVVLGDTLYLSALKEIGVSRTMPLVGTFPLASLFFEWLLLRHPASRALLLGTCLVVVGVICISTDSRRASDTGDSARVKLKLGIVLALSAAFLWGVSTVILKPGLAHIGLIHANAIRMPLVAILLYFTRVLPSRKENLRGVGRRTLLIVAASGALGMFLGSLLFLAALKQTSATMTVTLASTSPVMAMIMAVVFLKEKVSARILLGTGFCLAGVWLVM